MNYFGTTMFLVFLLRKCLPILDVFVRKYESYRRFNFQSDHGIVRGNKKNKVISTTSENIG